MPFSISSGEAACRELWKETGAAEYTLVPLSAYSVHTEEGETFGMLFYADITVLSPLPSFGIAEVRLMDELPDNWTYPRIQSFLLEKVREHLKNSKKRG